MSDIYKTPSSDLVVRPADSIGNIAVFTRFSTWYVLGLSIVTLNLYAAYWLYTRTKKLNGIVRNPISNLFCRITVALYCLSYAVFAGGEIADIADPYFVLASAAVDISGNILALVWVYMFRNRLHREFAGENFRIGIIAPFFFMHLYLNYKLNELLDLDRHIPGRRIEAQADAPDMGR